MRKILIALCVCVTVLALGTQTLLSQDDSGATKKDEKAKSIRYLVELEGLTEDNGKKVQEALQGIEGVSSVRIMQKKSKALVVAKAGETISEDAVKRAINSVEGVAFKSFEELPEAGSVKSAGAKENAKKPSTFTPRDRK